MSTSSDRDYYPPPRGGSAAQTPASGYAIGMMMADNFDRYLPGAAPEMVEATMDSAHLVAQGIAKKLTEAIAQTPGELDAQRWRQLVRHATQNAFMEVTGEGTLVKLGKNPSFAVAVAEATDEFVAPAGSDWALAIGKRQEQRLRQQLEAMEMPPCKINKLIEQWRANRKTQHE
jgi:hypothetical protein